MGRFKQSAIMALAAIAVTLPVALGPQPTIATMAEAPPLPVVGDAPPPEQVQVIRNLGAYGLGPELPGSYYAVVAHHLVRIDRATGRIQSILRPLPHLKQ